MSVRSVDQRPVTLDDIARRLGVHKTTVHRALIGTGRISDATRERIRDLAAALGYDAELNGSARRLSLAKIGRSAPSGAIALVMPRSSYRASFFLRLFQGAMDALGDTGHSLHCFTFADGDARDLAHAIARGAVDGAMLLSHPSLVGQLVGQLRSHAHFAHRPVLSLMNAVAGVPCVTADYRRGGQLLAGHLLDLGHRHLLHFFDPQDPGDDPGHDTQVGDRLLGIRDAYRERGLDPWRLLHGVRVDHAVLEADRDRDAVVRALARFPDVTALVAPHDPMALRLLAVLPQLGRRVPEDISVIGFDDSEPAAVAEAAQLTTIAVPLERIAADAARMMLRIVAAEAANAPSPRRHAVRLVARGSTAAPR